MKITNACSEFNTLNDAELLEVMLENKKAHTCIYLRHKEYCINFMKKYGADEVDAVDIYQDATIVLYEKMKRGNFKLTASIQTYLNQICYNQFLARNKSSYNKKTVLTDEIDENINDWFEEYSSSKNEKIEIILRELDKLKKENDICYERMRAFYYHKLTTADIAEKFGLKDSNSAKEQLSKCRKKIKNKIGL